MRLTTQGLAVRRKRLKSGMTALHLAGTRIFTIHGPLLHLWKMMRNTKPTGQTRVQTAL